MFERFTVTVLRAAIRPLATIGLVGVQAGIATAWAVGLAPSESAKDASSMLTPFTMMAMTFYFKDRKPETQAGDNSNTDILSEPRI